MASNVLVLVTDATPGGLSDGAGEALGLARQLADVLEGKLMVVLVDEAGGGATAEAAERGADQVIAIAADPSRPLGTTLLAGGAEAAARTRAGVIVVSRGPQVLEVAPRLAARLGGGCVMNVTGVDVVDGAIEATAAIFGGAARAVYRFGGSGASVISPTAGIAEAPPRESGRVAEVETLTVAGELQVRIVQPARAPEGPRLEDAPVVVSGGRGLRDGENYVLIRELAAALGGMPGASRAIVDDGWARPEEQVGLTGKIVAPQLYVAAGISGASQHLAGCANARTLVAINTDGEAPIFKYAQFGIVDDCLAVLPELIRLAKQRSSSR